MIRAWAARLKRDVLTLWVAARSPLTPWPQRLLALAVAGYALSPIDLIPDFIPLLGYLDDLLIVPLGIALCLRLIPSPLLVQFREQAMALARKPSSRFAALAIIVLWIAAAGYAIYLLAG